MSKHDFKFYLVASPLLGGFIGYVVSALLTAGLPISPITGITIMIGTIAGYLPLITFILGTRFIEFTDERKDSPDN